MERILSSVVIAGLVAAGLSVAQAGSMYKWIDSQGRVTYHDRPPPEGSGYRVEQRSVKLGESDTDESSIEKIVQKHPVTLYSVPVCGSCDMARVYLEKRKVPFTEHNLENNAELQQSVKKKYGSLSAPTIVIGEKVMKGYVESLLEGELDSVGYPKLEQPASAKDKKDDDADKPASEESGYRRIRRGRY